MNCDSDDGGREVSMSIYATLWQLKFPRYGDDHTGCDWITVAAQGVPDHIGSPSPGSGYEEGDPYAGFLPPAIEVAPDPDSRTMCAVVFVTDEMKKGTSRSGQEYIETLLVLTGTEYAAVSVGELHERICTALRGSHPRAVSERYLPDGSIIMMFSDGNSRVIQLK